MNSVFIILKIIFILDITLGHYYYQVEGKRYADNSTQTDLQHKKANKLIDFVLHSATAMIKAKDLQPFSIPTIKIRAKLPDKIFGISAGTGIQPIQPIQLILSNGTLVKGLETLRREGDASLTIRKSKSHELRKLSFQATIKNLEINTNFKALLLAFQPTGRINVTCEHILVYIEILIISPKAKAAKKNLKTNSEIHADDTVTLKFSNLRIVDTSPFEFDLDGFWPFNYFASQIATLINTTFKAKIIKLVEKKIKKIGSKLIGKLTSSASAKSVIKMALMFL